MFFPWVMAFSAFLTASDLKNGSFEESYCGLPCLWQPWGWDWCGNFAYFVARDDKTSGEQSLKIVDSDPGSNIVSFGQEVDLSRYAGWGAKFDFAVQAKWVGGSEAPRLRVYDFEERKYYFSSPLATAGIWQELCVVFPVTGRTRRVEVMICAAEPVQWGAIGEGVHFFT